MCYVYMSRATNFVGARDYCRSVGGELVTVTSAEMFEAVSDGLDQYGNVWIGYKSSGGGECASGSRSSKWHWESGSASTYTLWADGEPRCGSGNERCAVAYIGYSGAWTGVSCSSIFNAVCEVQGNECLN